MVALTGLLAYLLPAAKFLPSTSTFSAFRGLKLRKPASFQLLHRRSKTEILDIVVFDTAKRNVLKIPDMIKTRILGSSLFPAYPELPHEMRCANAKEFGGFFSELHPITC